MTWDPVPARLRVLSINDYCGDPDGIVQLAHQALSPSAELVGVIGTRISPLQPTVVGSAERSADAARTTLDLAGRVDVPVWVGCTDAMEDPAVAVGSAGVDALVAEAMRDDTDLDLFVVCGGGLTEIASALLAEPRIAERMTLVWIGGREHPGLAVPPDEGLAVEYNTGIDVVAAQSVFAGPAFPIWQVPRNAYAQVIASRSEMLRTMQPQGPLGAHLFEALATTVGFMEQYWRPLGEVYVLGDSPLVLLTALLGSFDRRPGSSEWVDLPRPRLAADGTYEPRADGPPLRVFTRLDCRLLLEDLWAKLARFAEA